jgi:hypothetical protein
MIDNLETIKPLLHFESEHDYYFLQILQRKKDRSDLDPRLGGSNNSNRLIKAYFVRSIDYLESHYYEIQQLCKLFNARAGINLNRRNAKFTSMQMMVQLAQSIQSENYFNYKTWDTVSGKYQPISDKRWIVDIDKEDMDEVYLIEDCIEECVPKDKTRVIERIPSKSGMHLITRPFNVLKLRHKYRDIDIHKNNPTNLYIP